MECAFRVSRFMPRRIGEIHPCNADRFTAQPRRKVEHVVGDAVPAVHRLCQSSNLLVRRSHQLRVVMVQGDADFPLVRPCVIDIGTSRERTYQDGCRWRLRSEQEQTIIPIVLLNFMDEFRTDPVFHRLLVGSPATDEADILAGVSDALQMFPLAVEGRAGGNDNRGDALALSLECLEGNPILHPPVVLEHVPMGLHILEQVFGAGGIETPELEDIGHQTSETLTAFDAADVRADLTVEDA